MTVSGVVTQLLPDSTGPDGPHEDFDVAVAGHVVEIDHNLTLAPRVPVAVGDTVTIHGQFEPDPGHPVIHYTHHATASHEGVDHASGTPLLVATPTSSSTPTEMQRSSTSKPD